MTSNLFSNKALGHESTDKRMELLRLIGITGSISQAAREAGVSYKAAWQAIHTLTNLAGVALVDRVVGGVGGGGAQLTHAAQQLLNAAQQMDGARKEVLARFTGGAAQALPGAGLRTSMRNNLPCTVIELQTASRNELTVCVRMQLPGGEVLSSSITKESSELLGLHLGSSVLALCKATAVFMYGLNKPEFRNRNANFLSGRVTRMSRGTLRDEVAMGLPGGMQLVGFTDKSHHMRVGSKVTACIDDNAVVIALV